MAIQQQRYEIDVYAEAMMLHGSVMSGLRLSDLLNDTSQAFITLETVKIRPFHNDALMGMEEHSQGLVNKQAIVIVAEIARSGETAANAGEIGGVRVQKQPYRILMYTDQSAINADIHLAPGAELDHYLVQAANRFLPVTNATVTSIMPGTTMQSFRADFMLVNRDHINYVGAGSAQPAAPVVAAPDLIG